MKFHLSPSSTRNLFTGYGDGFVAVNGTRHEASLILLPDRIVADWAIANIDDLQPADLQFLLELKPEVVLLGTGDRLRFPGKEVALALAHAGMGLEVMDTRAACRTYNILSEEGRNVAAALIVATGNET